MITGEDQSYAKMTVGDLQEIQSQEEHKVLGLNWNLDKDTFILKLEKVVEFGENLKPTKRNVLKIAAKVFDPLGLISPATVTLRMLLQELCARKSEVPSDLVEGLGKGQASRCQTLLFSRRNQKSDNSFTP